MSDEDFFSNQGNRYRGSRYPSFGSGTLDASGNLSQLARTANPAALENTLERQNTTAEAPDLPQIDIPNPVDQLGEAAVSAAIPYATTVAGRTAGTAIGAGAPVGEALGQGVAAIGRKASGLLSSAAGSGATQAATTGAAQAGASAAGSGLGSTAGSTAASTGSSAAGSTAGNAGISQGGFGDKLTSGSNIGGAVGAGIGTAAVGLLTGQEPEKAIKSGAGAALGTAVGSATPLGPIGGFIGGSIGGALGGRVICTELSRQGYMTQEDQLLDMHYTIEHLSNVHARGYFYWAYGYAKTMRREDWVGRLHTRIARALAIPRMEEIKYQVGLRKRPHYFGKVVRWIGEPMCYAIGYLLEDSLHSMMYIKEKRS